MYDSCRFRGVFGWGGSFSRDVSPGNARVSREFGFALRYASSSTFRLFLFRYFCIDRISVGLIGRFRPSDL